MISTILHRQDYIFTAGHHDKSLFYTGSDIIKQCAPR